MSSIDSVSTTPSPISSSSSKKTYLETLKELEAIFTDEDIKKYDKKILFFELRLAYANGFYTGRKSV